MNDKKFDLTLIAKIKLMVEMIEKVSGVEVISTQPSEQIHTKSLTARERLFLAEGKTLAEANAGLYTGPLPESWGKNKVGWYNLSYTKPGLEDT